MDSTGKRLALMAAIDDKIAALESALATGELTIESNGERVTYRSVADLVQALNYFKAQVAAASAAGNYGATLASFGR
jgi:hypothetical protein